MSPRIMCHHHTLSDADREFMTRKVARLKKFYERIHEVSIILDAERHVNQAEMLLWGPHLNLRVRGEAADMRSAFEISLDKAERALTKTKEKMHGDRSHRQRHVTIRRLTPRELVGAATAQAEPPAPSLAEAPLPVERLEPKVMTVGEARALMDNTRDIVVFINAHTQELNILHLNKENHPELIEVGEPDVVALDREGFQAATG